jgi:hypothetical protein
MSCAANVRSIGKAIDLKPVTAPCSSIEAMPTGNDNGASFMSAHEEQKPDKKIPQNGLFLASVKNTRNADLGKVQELFKKSG